jgi:hypothetical protein
MNSSELKSAIESISVQTEIDQHIVYEMLSDVIKTEFADFLNLMDDDIAVEADEDLNISIYILKEIRW